MKKTHSNKINRINYIVQENHQGVAELLCKEGYKIPNNLNTLTQLTKSWIRKDGKSAIIKLLGKHPERDAILLASGHSNFDNFDGCGCKSSFDGDCGCGCKSSYTGSDGKREEILELLKDNNPTEVLAHYEELKRLAKKYPEDQDIKLELEVTWDYMRHTFKKDQKRKEKKTIPEKIEESKNSKAILKLDAKDLAVGSFILGVALIVAQIKS